MSYPETACKSLEEIEEMFRPGGPRPWKTKVGESKLDEKIVDVVHAQERGHSVDFKSGAEGITMDAPEVKKNEHV